MVISKRLLALGATAAIIFAACGPGTSSSRPASQGVTPTQDSMSEPPATSTGGDKSDYTACVAFDTGGLGDKNFNDLAKKGLDDAKAAGYDTKFAEARGSTDYAANIARLVAEGCKTVITVGFLQSAATAEATGLFPEVAFAQVDTAWNLAGPDFIPGNADDTPFPPNFTGLDYQIYQAAMLAGYLSAGWSKSGKIATYGGLAFPGVTRFMDGFYAGAMYHNQEKGTDVKVLGWDGSKADPTEGGTFVGGSGGNDTWNDPGKGEAIANNFLDQNVDVLHPVAGATGNGSIKAMFEAGKWAVGVDSDQYISLGKPTNGALLTSAQKAIDVSVLDVINKHFEGDMGGEDYVGTLANDGVLLAPFHDFEADISAIEGLTAEIEALRTAISGGTVNVCDFIERC